MACGKYHTHNEDHKKHECIKCAMPRELDKLCELVCYTGKSCLFIPFETLITINKEG
jgi:hypothetical protein